MARPTFKPNTWINNRRVADGTEIYRGHSRWIVISPGRPPMSACPCCNKIFTDPEPAKIAADAYYPITPGDSGWVDADGKPILDELTKLIRQLAARQTSDPTASDPT